MPPSSTLLLAWAIKLCWKHPTAFLIQSPKVHVPPPSSIARPVTVAMPYSWHQPAALSGLLQQYRTPGTNLYLSCCFIAGKRHHNHKVPSTKATLEFASFAVWYQKNSVHNREDLAAAWEGMEQKHGLACPLYLNPGSRVRTRSRAGV